MSKPYWLSFCLLVIVSNPAPIFGTYVFPLPPPAVPAERLIRNFEAELKNHPDSTKTRYTLARVHYLCFATQSPIIAGYDDKHEAPYGSRDTVYSPSIDNLREFEATSRTLSAWGISCEEDIPSEKSDQFNKETYALQRRLMSENWKHAEISMREALAHAQVALEQFNRVIEEDPNNSLYYLGRASFGEQFLRYRQQTSDTLILEPLSVLSSISQENVMEDYYQAFDKSGDKERHSYDTPIVDYPLIIQEAGQAFLRLEKEKNNPSDKDASRKKTIQNWMTEYEKPRPADWVEPYITPIIFSLETNRALGDLLKPDSNILFDLNGDGVSEHWPWLRPTTALMVWDPDASGKITSGRQLFGSVTWWMFFSDGYQALEALDDNRDGTLSGVELRGIAAWFDRNENGISDAGEVVSLQSLGIVGIATQATGRTGLAWMNSAGLILEDGRTLPTYDWVTLPLKD